MDRVPARKVRRLTAGIAGKRDLGKEHSTAVVGLMFPPYGITGKDRMEMVGWGRRRSAC